MKQRSYEAMRGSLRIQHAMIVSVTNRNFVPLIVCLAVLEAATLAIVSPARGADRRNYFPVNKCVTAKVVNSGVRLSGGGPETGAALTLKDEYGDVAVAGTYDNDALTRLILTMRKGDILRVCSGPNVQITGEKFYQEVIISPISSRLRGHRIYTNPTEMTKITLSPYLGA